MILYNRNRYAHCLIGWIQLIAVSMYEHSLHSTFYKKSNNHLSTFKMSTYIYDGWWRRDIVRTRWLMSLLAARCKRLPLLVTKKNGFDYNSPAFKVIPIKSKMFAGRSINITDRRSHQINNLNIPSFLYYYLGCKVFYECDYLVQHILNAMLPTVFRMLCLQIRNAWPIYRCKHRIHCRY